MSYKPFTLGELAAERELRVLKEIKQKEKHLKNYWTLFGEDEQGNPLSESSIEEVLNDLVSYGLIKFHKQRKSWIPTKKGTKFLEEQTRET